MHCREAEKAGTTHLYPQHLIRHLIQRRCPVLPSRQCCAQPQGWKSLEIFESRLRGAVGAEKWEVRKWNH